MRYNFVGPVIALVAVAFVACPDANAQILRRPFVGYRYAYRTPAYYPPTYYTPPYYWAARDYVTPTSREVLGVRYYPLTDSYSYRYRIFPRRWSY